MSDSQIAGTLLAVGMLLSLGGWAFFRKPGYDFFTMVPFTKAHQYMELPGAIMWWVGIATLLVGVFKTWALPA